MPFAIIKTVSKNIYWRYNSASGAGYPYGGIADFAGINSTELAGRIGFADAPYPLRGQGSCNSALAEKGPKVASFAGALPRECPTWWSGTMSSLTFLKNPI